MSNSRYRKNSSQNYRQIQKAQPESTEILPALASNLLGDWMRVRLDPQLRNR